MKAADSTSYRLWPVYILTGFVAAGWSLVAFVFYEELYLPNTVVVRFWWIDDTLRWPIMGVLAVGSLLSFILIRLIIYRLLSQIVAFVIVFSFALLLTPRLTSETNAQRLNSIALSGHTYHLLIASGHYPGTNIFGSPNAVLLQCDTLNIGCHIIWSDDLDDLMPWEDPYRDMALYLRDDTVVVSTPQTVFFTYED